MIERVERLEHMEEYRSLVEFDCSRVNRFLHDFIVTDIPVAWATDIFQDASEENFLEVMMASTQTLKTPDYQVTTSRNHSQDQSQTDYQSPRSFNNQISARSN